MAEVRWICSFCAVTSVTTHHCVSFCSLTSLCQLWDKATPPSIIMIIAQCTYLVYLNVILFLWQILGVPQKFSNVIVGKEGIFGDSLPVCTKLAIQLFDYLFLILLGWLVVAIFVLQAKGR